LVKVSQEALTTEVPNVSVETPEELQAKATFSVKHAKATEKPKTQLKKNPESVAAAKQVDAKKAAKKTPPEPGLVGKPPVATLPPISPNKNVDAAGKKASADLTEAKQQRAENIKGTLAPPVFTKKVQSAAAKAKEAKKSDKHEKTIQNVPRVKLDLN